MTSTNNKSIKWTVPFLSLSLLLINIVFFYLYSISLNAVLVSLIYFFISAILPGYLLALLFFQLLTSNKEKQPSWDLLVPLLTIFGIANILVSYLAWQITDVHGVIYAFAWPYLLLLNRSTRALLKATFSCSANNRRFLNSGELPIILLFTLAFNIYFFAMRPTPGILPLEIFHDHLWNAGNTVSLTSDFPLRSMNIESKPFLSYHILIHIIGAHMAVITGLTPHLVGLQYVFIPLVPILILNMTSLLRQFFKENNAYLLYGLAVLLFGGGFFVVHEVKVLNLNSSTNFIGVVLLFSVTGLILRLEGFSNPGRFLSLFIGLFLATVAKGTIGICLFGGMALWLLFKLLKKSFGGSDVFDFSGAFFGFLLSFFFFFVWPTFGQEFKNVLIEKGSFPLIPLTYVTKNFLTSGFVGLIYKYFPQASQIPIHALLTLLFLPLYVLLYYSYRLLVFYNFKIKGISEEELRIFMVVVASLLLGCMVNVPSPQDHAYFITAAVFLLDILFILYAKKEQLFGKIRDFYRGRQIFGLVGAIFVCLLPFVDIAGKIRDEHIYNFIMYGKVGQWLNPRLERTRYRKSHQSITPELYAALSYIRKFTPKDIIVISPLVTISDGRALAFYTSTFGERTAYIEGYFQSSTGIAKYAEDTEVKKRIRTIEALYTQGFVPEEIDSSNYVFLVEAGNKSKFDKRYTTTTLYENGEWSILKIDKAIS